MENMQNHKWNICYGDENLGIFRGGRRFLFSYVRGGMTSMLLDGQEWLYRETKPALWRALTDNDRGCAFGYQSGIWMAADFFLPCKSVSLAVDGREFGRAPVGAQNNDASLPKEGEVIRVTFHYETITCPTARILVHYNFQKDGTLRVAASYHGKEGLPELPVFGMRFIAPMTCDGYVYEGLSGETYPDRMKGGIPGVYEVEGLPVTPYLVPQDCGMHMQTEWVKLLAAGQKDGSPALQIARDTEPFAFSCLPYTPQELENATHIEELPLARRTVLTIYGKVRGVGGIDSWGREPESAYHISGEKEHAFSFCVK